jgi:ribonuclease P protein subunit POP4
MRSRRNRKRWENRTTRRAQTKGEAGIDRNGFFGGNEMNLRKENIHKHELIGLYAKIQDSYDKGIIGIEGRIIDETKNTFKIEIRGYEKTIQKDGTLLSVRIANEDVGIDASKLRFRPEDRIKKARRKAAI